MAFFLMDSIRSGDLVAKSGCYLCLRDHDDGTGPLVDFDMLIVGEGRLVVCANCLEAVTSLLGYLSPRQSAQLGDELKAVKAELRQARMVRGKAEKAVEALRDYDNARSSV